MVVLGSDVKVVLPYQVGIVDNSRVDDAVTCLPIVLVECWKSTRLGDRSPEPLATEVQRKLSSGDWARYQISTRRILRGRLL